MPISPRCPMPERRKRGEQAAKYVSEAPQEGVLSLSPRDLLRIKVRDMTPPVDGELAMKTLHTLTISERLAALAGFAAALASIAGFIPGLYRDRQVSSLSRMALTLATWLGLWSLDWASPGRHADHGEGAW